MSKKVRRLFGDFVPEHYDVALDLDKPNMSFKGSVMVSGRKTGRPSQRLTLHQKDLKITSAKIVKHDKKGKQEIEISRINNHQTFDEVRLHSNAMIYPGSYTVTLEFSGQITRPMNGLYPCFFDEAGQPKTLLATQFESHHAREVFPCIDEPEAKATFDLSLTSPIKEIVIANTPIKTQKKSGQKLTTVFETTPKMPTYLLAFVVGELKFLEASTAAGTIVRAYATPENVKHTKFALDVAVKTLEFYNDYFGIDYPLPKCDLIALPDFASGAMENWGCITFREQCLLVDPKNTSLSVKQYVAMVVAHELAHQWFGNLVTMRWWTDLWLNEGFASWIEYLATDHNFPDWHMWTQFVVDEQEQGLKLDALEHTHPIEAKINHPDEIRTIFDTISYSKGASVIHMLHGFLGAEDFKNGLRHYLQTHAYGNADTVDLWAALEHVSKKPVKDFMHAWTTQPGFPMLQADIGPQATVTQKRFYLNPSAKISDSNWPVPLLGSEPTTPDIIKTAEQILELKNPDNLVLNHGRNGFYRVSYNAEHLQKLSRLIRAGKLSELDRVSLLSDATEAAKAGYCSTNDVLELLGAYENETSSVVWDIIAGLLGNVRHVMNDEALRENMKPYIRQLTAKQLARLGWQAKAGEPHFDSLLRPLILGLASLSGEASVVAEALKRFETMKSLEDLEPDLRGVIYGTAARDGKVAYFDKMLALHDQAKNSEDRVALSSALTGFKSQKLIQRALAHIDSDQVRLQDASYWIAYSFMNRHAKDTTWQWMTAHWDWLEQNLGSDLSFYRFPVYAARAYSDAAFLPTFQKFFETNMSPAFERPVNQGIETIQWQAAWRARDLPAIKKFFKAQTQI